MFERRARCLSLQTRSTSPRTGFSSTTPTSASKASRNAEACSCLDNELTCLDNQIDAKRTALLFLDQRQREYFETTPQTFFLNLSVPRCLEAVKDGRTWHSGRSRPRAAKPADEKGLLLYICGKSPRPPGLRFCSCVPQRWCVRFRTLFDQHRWRISRLRSDIYAFFSLSSNKRCRGMCFFTQNVERRIDANITIVFTVR